MLEWIIENEAITGIAMSVIGLVFAFVKKTQAAKKWKATRMLSFIQAGVEEAYSTFVREAKDRWEDGKLSEDDRVEARNIAMDAAIYYAKANGMDLIKYYGAEMLPSVLERVVGINKTMAVPLAITPAEF